MNELGMALKELSTVTIAQLEELVAPEKAARELRHGFEMANIPGATFYDVEHLSGTAAPHPANYDDSFRHSAPELPPLADMSDVGL